MSANPGTNWQIMLADLSIILFLTTFSALAQNHAAARAAPEAKPVAVSEPVAIWRAGGGAPPLGDWLKTQAPDPRMRINVYGGYVGGNRDAIIAQAGAISTDPALSGRDVRMILEPSDSDFVTVTLSYDRT